MGTIIYHNDLSISRAILSRDAEKTSQYLYHQYYPLFKSIYNNYETDCENVIEFINEIYYLIIRPSEKTGRCQLENYRGESTLSNWLKVTCLYYCYGKYKKKKSLEILPNSELLQTTNENSDRLTEKLFSYNSIESENLSRSDLEIWISLMPNTRYQKIIRLIYIEHHTLEETAQIMEMKIENLYNKHKLAKAQFERIYNKENGI